MRYYFLNNIGDEGHIETDNIVEAIHEAWNYEANLYDENDKLIFAPWESNKFNTDILKEYGYKIINSEKYRRVKNIKTGEIYKAPWEMNN